MWKHFTKVAGGAKAQCKLCEKELPTLGGNTTGLHNHLRTVHPNKSSYTSTQKCKLEKHNNKQIIIKITKSERVKTELPLQSENEK